MGLFSFRSPHSQLRYALQAGQQGFRDLRGRDVIGAPRLNQNAEGDRAVGIETEPGELKKELLI